MLNISSNGFDSLDSVQDQHNHIKMIKKQARNSYIALGVFIFILTLVCLIREYLNQQKIVIGNFYEKVVKKRQVPDIWKMTVQQRSQQQSVKNKNLAGSQQFKITRQQLGRNSWSLLHMMAASFPDQISYELAEQFNVFLILFTKFYPCKLCSNHFMQILNRKQQKNLFTGKTKDQLMLFLCGLHNLANKDLGKQQFDCSKVNQRWNTCGCSSQQK